MRDLTNGGGDAQDAPPSTLAANLVCNISNTRRPPNNDEHENFQQLLLEVSNLGDGIDDSTSLESRIEYNHKLIYVVVKSVLVFPEKDGLFANKEQRLQQASEGLDVLIATIRETPSVLAHVNGPLSSVNSGADVPLWIWLFPHLLVLVGDKRSEALQPKIADLFKRMVNHVSKSLDVWTLNLEFFYYLRNCADSALDHLQELIPTTYGQPKPVSLTLPRPSTEEDVSQLGKPDFHAYGCTYTLQDFSCVLQHVHHLLALIGDICISTSASYHITPVFQALAAWIFDCFVDMRHRCTQRKEELGEQFDFESCHLSLHAIHDLLSSLGHLLCEAVIRKGFRVLTDLCANFVEFSAALSETSSQTLFCKILLDIAYMCIHQEPVCQAVRLRLYPALKKLTDSNLRPPNLSLDIDQSMNLLGRICKVPEAGESIPDSSIFSDDSVRAYFRGLNLETSYSGDAIPQIKRRKLSQEGELLNELIGDVYSLFGSQKATDLVGLSQVVVPCFAPLSNSDRCVGLANLGRIACASADSLALDREFNGKPAEPTCSVCDLSSQVNLEKTKYNAGTAREAIATLENLVSSSPEFEQSRKPRVVAMMALRSFATHFKEDEFMLLETSYLGQWCFRSLASSLRELRVAAGRALAVFLTDGCPIHVLSSNKSFALDNLKNLSDLSTVHLTETFVLAWGQVGCVVRDRELNLVLLRLVEYLGHPNQIVSGAAFNEIMNVAESHDEPVGQMMSPFWRSIAHTAVKDLHTRPQTAQLMADLLSVSVSDFLIMTQTYTMPWLVLTRRTEVITKIAQARKDEDPLYTCLDSFNLRAIMALLLVQNISDLDTFIMDLFRNVSIRFSELDLLDIFRVEPIGIALELLKNAGEEDDSRKSRVRHALQFLASRWYSALGDSSQRKRGNQVGLFLEYHTLGIMSEFSDVLNDLRGWQSAADKRRALKGIEEMLRVGKSYVRSALPQICACLQSALGIDDIRTTAFTAWVTMIRSLDDEDVGPLLENTFSTIILQWKAFDSDSRQHACGLAKYLLDKRTTLMRDYVEVIPSLSEIPELSVFDKKFRGIGGKENGIRQLYQTFSYRISHEHSSVVTQALSELSIYLQKHQSFLQASAISEQPDIIVGELIRNILDACVKFNSANVDIARLSAECIGLIGCLDSNRVEAVRERKEIIVVSNFDDATDTTGFVLFILREVLVKAFLSATNPKAQGFLSYAMQELLDKCNFREVCEIHRKPGDHSATNDLYQKWLTLPEGVQATLTPFLKSKYVLTEMLKASTKYPIFEPDKKYSVWLRAFVLDLLEKPNNVNASLLFAPLCRVIRIQDTSVADFLLPFVVLHAIVSGTDDQRENITQELLKVLAHEAPADSHAEQTNLKMCSGAVFRILDYISRWAQEKQTKASHSRGLDSRWSHFDDDPSPLDTGVQRVNALLSAIPAETISKRAVECNSYARALFHWEQHIRQLRDNSQKLSSTSPLLERLQDIYTQIDEPDGIEGISAHLHILDIDQQILGHRKAGRWTAAQSWYEIKLAENPEDIDVQVNLLKCLKESGQHDVLLNYVEGMHPTSSAVSKLLPFATEAAWATGRWETLRKYLSLAPEEIGGDFNISVGRTLLALHGKDKSTFSNTIRALREQLACSLSADSTSSLGVCHDTMLKFHVLTELEMIASSDEISTSQRSTTLESLDRRLEIIGAYLNDKQYLLGIRRAVMQLSTPAFTKGDIAASWLTSARLARKGNSIHQSFNAVLHASKLGDESATIEHARLLWKEGQHRKAIQSLQGAIDNNAFISHNRGPAEDATTFTAEGLADQQNLLTARAHLLLAKWLDSAGQTHSNALRSQYQLAARLHQSWEKGHYYLGRHYNKLLESEKSLAPEHQTQPYLTGEMAKLVIENYLRSLSYGTKYIYQTLPRILTLWLDLGSQVNQPMDPKYGTKEFLAKLTSAKKDQLAALHGRFSKYVQKMPAYIFYTALPQIVARIAHTNNDVYKFLQQIIIKVVSAHPQQALWSLLAVSTSTQPDRKARGMAILSALRSSTKKVDVGSYDLKNLIRSGEKLADQLLMVCNAGEFQGNRPINASITKDLGFNHKICTPSPLAVPIESVLTATLPTLTDSVRTHKAFSRDIVTISNFADDVLILSSLQKPRKLTARGSDGRNYGLLCKPKDDLRKDQRLMEFNSMINRSLKRDAESSKRQLYIKTYAVTPLNEECGIIEWVNGLKTLRDILLNLYKVRGIQPNYAEIKLFLDEACKSDEKLPLFNEKVIRDFPPVFHSWFVQQFPEPSAWFVARLKYTRSCAVMSMVGTILGLGDRHGENILFEEGNGGTFHVDFNCLFDKGLTFQQPERVPFRLTHNMVDAMGVYGYEGPFRKSCELTLRLLRTGEDTLMTILEAFVYDPTLDLLAKKREKKRERDGVVVPDTAQGVLDSIRRKVRGLLAGESVPLAVEGQVDELIKQAVSTKNLAAMYIGWCAFF